MTNKKSDCLNFEKTEFVSISQCVMVKREAQPFLNRETELNSKDFNNLRAGSKKAFEFYKKEYIKQQEQTQKNGVIDRIRELAKILKQLKIILTETQTKRRYTDLNNGSSDLYSIGDIQKKTVEYVSKKALFEEGNINKISHTILSAHTDSPINLMFLAPPSEGKTHVITSTADAFPDQYVKIYRDASPKSFTRDKGELALRVITDGVRDYITEISNPFTEERTTVKEYLSWVKEEIDRKDSSYNRSELKEALNSIQTNLVTLISLENQCIIFLDRPNPELVNSILSVLSHDSYYTESMFVEGVGVLHTKTIVFKGWPAFIFATTRDEAATFQDLESRFEICEPVMIVEKYRGAIDRNLRNTFGIQSEGDQQRRKDLKHKNEVLIESIQSTHVRPLMAYDPKSIFDLLFDKKIEHGGLMRQIPRLFQHVGMNALWNLADRVLLTDGEETYVVIAADDLKILSTLYGDLKLNALLSGLSASYYEFLNFIILPLFKEKDDLEEKTKDKVELKKIREYFIKYAQSSDNHELKKDRMAFNRYIKFFVEKGYIQKIDDEQDKRKKWIVLLVEPESFVNSIDEKIKKIGTSAKTLAPAYLGSLLNRNFTAFHRGQKIGTTCQEKAGKGKNLQNENVQETHENTDSIVNTILALSGYLPAFLPNVVPNFNNIVDNGIKTDNTASADKSENDIAQKSAEILDVPNFSSDENSLKHESRYVLLSILEDINVAAEDGYDYTLRKNDIVHIPEINANLLIKRGWAREIQPQQSKKENNQVPPFQNDGTLGTHGTELKPGPTKTDFQNEKSNHDEKPESIEPITKEQAEEIKNTLLRNGIHLKATDTGISIGGDRYNIGVPVSHYRQNSEMIDQTMSKWNFTKKNDGALGTVFFDIPLKKGVQP
jgi:DNA-binding MarR family transcriptional regulator